MTMVVWDLGLSTVKPKSDISTMISTISPTILDFHSETYYVVEVEYAHFCLCKIHSDIRASTGCSRTLLIYSSNVSTYMEHAVGRADVEGLMWAEDRFESCFTDILRVMDSRKR